MQTAEQDDKTNALTVARKTTWQTSTTKNLKKRKIKHIWNITREIEILYSGKGTAVYRIR